MTAADEQLILDFYTYPPVGGDDWRYAFETAQIRAIEMQMFSKATLVDMANAEDFRQAVEFLSSTEYAVAPGRPGDKREIERAEQILRGRRKAVRELFAELMLDKAIVELFRTRDDFANLRLAVRRSVTAKPLGTDYSDEGNFAAERFEEVFEGENTELLPVYMQQAAERAVLAYYQNKDIRQIDYSIDSFQAEYNLNKARELKSIFLTGLFRIQVDLTNIRTMLRLKFTESEQRNAFLGGGFVGLDRLRDALEAGYESMAAVFFVTPYYQVVEAGANYLASNDSFLAAEQKCDEFLTGFLRTTIQITAGPQPIIAYLLLKETEIRTVRLILTAKKNYLDTKLVLDRVG